MLCCPSTPAISLLIFSTETARCYPLCTVSKWFPARVHGITSEWNEIYWAVSPIITFFKRKLDLDKTDFVELLCFIGNIAVSIPKSK